MIRNVYLNGKINTLLVLEEEGENEYMNPLVEALREQAERISVLEKQNQDLMKQEKILLNLLEVSAATGDIMAQSLKSLESLENLEKKVIENSKAEDHPEESEDL